jgi:hypothetical protein
MLSILLCYIDIKRKLIPSITTSILCIFWQLYYSENMFPIDLSHFQAFIIMEGESIHCVK